MVTSAVVSKENKFAFLASMMVALKKMAVPHLTRNLLITVLYVILKV